MRDEAKSAGGVVVKPTQDNVSGGYAGYCQHPDGHLWKVARKPQWVVQE